MSAAAAAASAGNTDSEAEPAALEPDGKNPLPTDAESWRALIGKVPPRDLLRILLKDKAVQGKIFAGFRPGADTLRRSLVVQRIAELALKDGKWAKQIAELAPELQDVPEPQPKQAEPIPEVFAVPVGNANPRLEDPRLQSKLKQQRSDLREKDVVIASLKAKLASVEAERDTVLRRLSEAETARLVSETEVERERRQRQRAERRDGKAKIPTEARKADISPLPMSAAPPPAVDGLLIEGLQRLLSRGKYALVAEVARETISAHENGTLAATATRGHVHAVYASALYGLGQIAGAAAEDQRAAELLLDGGELVRSAVSLGRILISAPLVRPAALAPLFRRLFALAEKAGHFDRVGDALLHVRIASPAANQRLRDTIGKAGSGDLYARLAHETGRVLVGPDEQIALPTASHRAASVSARRIAEAADSGDGAFIADCRSGIRELQSQGPEQRAVANALLEAVAALDTLATVPLSQLANRPVVLDASNVARYNPDPLSMAKVMRNDNLLQLRAYLMNRGFFPVLMIADANLRFKVDQKNVYVDLVARGIVRESPPGTSADEEILSVARSLGAPVVTNDRLSEWGDRAAGVERLGFVIDRSGPSLTQF